MSGTVARSAAREVETPQQLWLRKWREGPTEPELAPLRRGDPAPSARLLDDQGVERDLSEFWSQGPALILFWRHFGCSCGVARARRLREEHESYVDAGLRPVIVAQGEPSRARQYRLEHSLPCEVLCDPGHHLYRSYGLGQWPVERVLFDAPPEYWTHDEQLGRELQQARVESGRPMVDDPWRAVGEFVVQDERVWLTVMYQHCEDYPDPRLLTTAAHLAVAGRRW